MSKTRDIFFVTFCCRCLLFYNHFIHNGSDVNSSEGKGGSSEDKFPHNCFAFVMCVCVRMCVCVSSVNVSVFVLHGSMTNCIDKSKSSYLK